ncbi:hypothetical protein APA_754 [Pseudanabaena sp. lw0831]|uniref:eCIS core domain-containing protein n=1 Tax=Pseudanabaena sp. lw0831 TaxID=1357935 RepID=UPI001A270281|nr:DUF4157 domain-containing protein [Pseudanabaena sp. lw0831]GBO52953.1 hypothetical protein APA_754 [Pseudanabaena sp. lw0831]
MGQTNDRSTKASSLVNPTSLNLQPRPFAPLESEEKDEAISRKSGYTENFLEKIINTPSSEATTPVQRKSGNRLKAIAVESMAIQSKPSTNIALQKQPIQKQESVEEEKNEGEQEEGKEFTMNPEPPPIQRKFGNRLKAIAAERMNPEPVPVQRKSGNRLKAIAAERMAIQAKLAIGEPNDKYEQEADATAARVVQQINSSANSSTNASITSQNQPIQRQELEEDEELQMKPLVQRSENIGGGEASTDLESSIQSARGSGQSLDANLQQSMEQAMGADFSGVKVHTDSQSDQLNKSIQAKAFTTGQDLFFRQGAYEPSSRGGQELIAHELTHVVQQNGNMVQKKPTTTTPQVQATVKTKADIQRDGDEATSKPAEEPASKVDELHQGVGKKFMFKLYEDAAVAKVEFDPIVSNIASITNGAAKIPKLKDQNTAVAKSEGEYGGDHSRLVDICRASIIYNSYRDLMLGLGKSKEMLTLVREKDRFAKPTPAGYRDILLNVKLSNGHIAELQLHLQQIMDVKNGVGHKLYEEVRSIERAAKEAGKALDPEETAKVDQLLQESRIHYDAALEKSQSADEAPST